MISIKLPLLFLLIKFLGGFIKTDKIFRKKIVLKPCLHDYNAQAGAVFDEYFWLDLFVAQLIKKTQPKDTSILVQE